MAVLGISETLCYLITRIYKADECNNLLLLFPNNADIEYQLRSCVAKVKWRRCLHPKKIYCVDSKLTKEAREICELFCREYSCIEMISAEDLINKIKNYSDK